MKSNAAEYFKNLSLLKADLSRKSGAKMYETSIQNGRSGRCHCCPYGYHIDLDFVRYCQSLNQGSKNDSPTLTRLKKLKKERRRQTKSMEVMLGINSTDSITILPTSDSESAPTTTTETTPLTGKAAYARNRKPTPIPPPRDKKRLFEPPSPPPRKQSLTHPALQSPPPPDIINSSKFLITRNDEAADALQEAVLDFEEALESSRDYNRQCRKMNSYLPTVDLLHHTNYPLASSWKGPTKTSNVSVGRSNSLPRQFPQEPPGSMYIRQNSKEWNTPSYSAYNYTNGSYGPSSQNPLMADAMAALNAARGCSTNLSQDFDTLSINSGMSGVSTSTLQSIRDQMATGLSRLRELEKEVEIIPSLQTKLNILREEKRILMDHFHSHSPGDELPHIPHLDSDVGDLSDDELDGRLQLLKRFPSDRRHSNLQRKRSISPMRVNLEDFRSYRRARASSMSEGSDTESVHSFREKSKERADTTRLYISESTDYYTDRERKYGRPTSVPSTPMFTRKGSRDAAVNCRALTRDVGTSHIGVRLRSIGVVTDKVIDYNKENDKKREIKPKPCLQCFRRTQKSFEHRGVGTESPKRDSGRLSMSSVSSENYEPDELESKSSGDHDTAPKNAFLEKLGKKSPIISRLSEPQLFPPTLTFDNATNTEPINLRDQRVNTILSMDSLYTKEQLNNAVKEAQKQWEETHKGRLSVTLQEIRKPFTREASVQTHVQEPKAKSVHNIGVQVRYHTRDSGMITDKPVPVKVRSIGCGDCLVEEKPIVSKTRSVAVGEFRLTDIWCNDCLTKKLKPMRSVGIGSDRINDPIHKPVTVHTKNVGVGDARVTDEICKKCKMKYTKNVHCQAQPSTHSVYIEAKLPTPTPKETPPATTPETERRSFGSSGVTICDKCHEAITSVAKDIVHTSSGGSLPPLASQSKIPRLVESQKPEIVVTEIKVPEPTIPRERNSQKDEHSPRSKTVSHSTQSLPECPPPPKELPPVAAYKSPLKEDITSLPTVGSPTQTKRIPYGRQDTYTKSVGGFVNLAFDEALESPKQLDRSSPERKPPPKLKPKPVESPKLRKIPEKKMTPPKEESSTEPEAVIHGKAEEKSIASSSSSSSSSSEEDESEDEGSAIAPESSATISLQSSSVFNPEDAKGQKKHQPTRAMKAALKVLNDSIGKPTRSGQQLTNAINIIQKEWFKISSQKDANPQVVEDYMDAFEDHYSKGLLHRVVNLSDINGNTAMHYAVSHGNFDVVSVLLDSKVCNINQQNKAGYTAVMLVALAQIKNQAHASVVNRLFQLGDVNIKASQHGQTALMLAVSHGRLDMVRMLIPSGADVNIQDEDGSTALMCAAEHGHLAIVKYLVSQQDTDLYLMDNDGSTALTIAVEAGHKDVGVLLYKQMNLSRGGPSPYSSMRSKRPKTPTMSRSAITPPPRSSAPASPGRSRKSSGRVSPANARQSSASLSNLIL